MYRGAAVRCARVIIAFGKWLQNRLHLSPPPLEPHAEASIVYARRKGIQYNKNGQRRKEIEQYKNNNKSTYSPSGRCLKVGGTIGPYHAPLDRPRRR